MILQVEKAYERSKLVLDRSVPGFELQGDYPRAQYG
jgi:hypothetical protein